MQTVVVHKRPDAAGNPLPLPPPPSPSIRNVKRTQIGDECSKGKLWHWTVWPVGDVLPIVVPQDQGQSRHAGESDEKSYQARP